MTILPLNENESKIFGRVCEGEIRVLVNEYDDDTGRKPEKHRMSALPHLRKVYRQWINTQKTVGHTRFGVVVDADHCNSCSLTIDVLQQKYLHNVLERYVQSLEAYIAKYPQPYMGMLKIVGEDALTGRKILDKLSA